jgi:hypothetical protein
MLQAPPARVLQDDLDFIRHPDPCSESPYLNVVPHKGGWRARAFRKQVGPVEPTPRGAAVHLVSWWKWVYGERWREYWAFRQSSGWQVRRARSGRCDVQVWIAAGWGCREQTGWLVPSRGGFTLSPLQPSSPRFAGDRSARQAFRRWVKDTFGLYAEFASVIVRRSSTPTHRLGRMTPVPHRAA